MRKFSSNFILIIAAVLILTLTDIAPVQAITFNFNWHSNHNYSAKGSFSYDESKAPKNFSEKGIGATNILDSLDVSFFDNQNKIIATYNNVVNGISKINYFKFNFNTVTKEIFGEIDLGGEKAGETYLSGIVNNKLSLFHVPQSGDDLIIGRNSGAIDIADYVLEQAQPSDMLFCLHHRLLHAHKKEKPELVKQN